MGSSSRTSPACSQMLRRAAQPIDHSCQRHSATSLAVRHHSPALRITACTKRTCQDGEPRGEAEVCTREVGGVGAHFRVAVAVFCVKARVACSSRTKGEGWRGQTAQTAQQSAQQGSARTALNLGRMDVSMGERGPADGVDAAGPSGMEQGSLADYQVYPCGTAMGTRKCMAAQAAASCGPSLAPGSAQASLAALTLFPSTATADAPAYACFAFTTTRGSIPLKQPWPPPPRTA